VTRRGVAVRIATVATAAAALTLLAAFGRVPIADSAVGDDLLPDLRTLPAAELYVSGSGTELRLSNTVGNRGVGPLEIFPEQTAGGDCDGNGDVDNDREAFQRVYKDSADAASLGFYDYHFDTDSSYEFVGCMVFHAAHNHWHFENFADYVLRDGSNRVVARSSKVSFCIADGSKVYPRIPGAFPYVWYPVPSGTCTATSTEGLSVGWADTYTAATQGQSIDISDVAAGSYCLVSRADRRDLLRETRNTNNAYRTPILLDPDAGTVAVLGGKC
jgi:Lysyl oxidase